MGYGSSLSGPRETQLESRASSASKPKSSSTLIWGREGAGMSRLPLCTWAKTPALPPSLPPVASDCPLSCSPKPPPGLSPSFSTTALTWLFPAFSPSLPTPNHSSPTSFPQWSPAPTALLPNPGALVPPAPGPALDSTRLPLGVRPGALAASCVRWAPHRGSGCRVLGVQVSFGAGTDPLSLEAHFQHCQEWGHLCPGCPHPGGEKGQQVKALSWCPAPTPPPPRPEATLTSRTMVSWLAR